MTNVLICMRLADMERVHPNQDNSRVCGSCGVQVGIYPSGQFALKCDPTMIICCQVCTVRDKTAIASANIAPGALNEQFESIPNPKRSQ